jgi:hypothetical protein
VDLRLQDGRALRIHLPMAIVVSLTGFRGGLELLDVSHRRPMNSAAERQSPKLSH